MLRRGNIPQPPDKNRNRHTVTKKEFRNCVDVWEKDAPGQKGTAAVKLLQVEAEKVGDHSEEVRRIKRGGLGLETLARGKETPSPRQGALLFWKLLEAKKMRTKKN